MTLAIAILTLLGAVLGLLSTIDKRRAQNKPERDVEAQDVEIDQLTVEGSHVERSALLKRLWDKARRSVGDRGQ